MKNIIILLLLIASFTLKAQSADDLYNQANTIAETDLDNYKIKDILKKAIALDSVHLPSYLLLGKHYLDRKGTYYALESLSKAYNLDSTNMDVKWYYSTAIIKYNIRGSERTDEGIFEGLSILESMLKNGAKSTKIYERIAVANEYILADYLNRYKNYKPKTTSSWQDDKVDNSEKEKFKKIALQAFEKIKLSLDEILKIEPIHEWALSTKKYLKEPVFN